MMNKKLKNYYFHNTNHGGCCGNSKGGMIRGDHVLPLMRMCQRNIMWKLGHGEEFFNRKGKEGVEAKNLGDILGRIVSEEEEGDEGEVESPEI